MESYQIGKPDSGDERTWAEVEKQLPPHVLAVLKQPEKGK